MLQVKKSEYTFIFCTVCKLGVNGKYKTKLQRSTFLKKQGISIMFKCVLSHIFIMGNEKIIIVPVKFNCSSLFSTIIN